jgi:hypothetical protein
MNGIKRIHIDVCHMYIGQTKDKQTNKQKIQKESER